MLKRGAPRPLLNDQVSLQGAGGLDRLQNGDDPRRLETDAIEAADKGAQTRAAKHGELPALFVGFDLG